MYQGLLETFTQSRLAEAHVLNYRAASPTPAMPPRRQRPPPGADPADLHAAVARQGALLLHLRDRQHLLHTAGRLQLNPRVQEWLTVRRLEHWPEVECWPRWTSGTRIEAAPAAKS